MTAETYQMVIFDVDGTLAEKYILDLLPGVEDFFRLINGSSCAAKPKVAIATNQGGVGMRHWMELQGFGNPEKYPTQADIEERMRKLTQLLLLDSEAGIYAAYRYRNREGKWSPVPPEGKDNPRWSKDWRKPNPGMLLQAMQDADVAAADTLFIGDSPDDQDAARAAGCDFQWAETFFPRHWATCEDLERNLRKIS
jgi:HAD superfamily hydrolase (TIGR01662 family)